MLFSIPCFPGNFLTLNTNISFWYTNFTGADGTGSILDVRQNGHLDGLNVKKEYKEQAASMPVGSSARRRRRTASRHIIVESDDDSDESTWSLGDESEIITMSRSKVQADDDSGEVADAIDTRSKNFNQNERHPLSRMSTRSSAQVANSKTSKRAAARVEASRMEDGTSCCDSDVLPARKSRASRHKRVKSRSPLQIYAMRERASVRQKSSTNRVKRAKLDTRQRSPECSEFSFADDADNETSDESSSPCNLSSLGKAPDKTTRRMTGQRSLRPRRSPLSSITSARRRGEGRGDGSSTSSEEEPDNFVVSDSNVEYEKSNDAKLSDIDEDDASVHPPEHLLSTPLLCRGSPREHGASLKELFYAYVKAHILSFLDSGFREVLTRGRGSQASNATPFEQEAWFAIVRIEQDTMKKRAIEFVADGRWRSIHSALDHRPYLTVFLDKVNILPQPIDLQGNIVSYWYV